MCYDYDNLDCNHIGNNTRQFVGQKYCFLQQFVSISYFPTLSIDIFQPLCMCKNSALKKVDPVIF